MDFSSIDISAISSKRNSGKKDDEEETAELDRVRVKKSLTAHQTRRILSEVSLEKELPWHFEPNATYHCVSMGDVDSLTYLRVIVKQQPIEYCLLSTWCMAITDIEEISKWLEAGYIKRMDFYVGEIFTSRYASEWQVLKALVQKHGGRVALFRNHSKVMAGFGRDFDFSIASSANVNTNPRTEQATVTIDTDVALFYKEFYDGIKSFDHNFDDWKPYAIER